MSVLTVDHLVRKGRKRKRDGKVAIHTRVTYKRERAEFSTKIFVREDQWDPKKGEMKVNQRGAREVNRALHDIREGVYQTERMLREKNATVSASSIRDHYLGKGEKQKTLIEVFDEHDRDFFKLVERGE